jgi:hypothetical protein
MRTFFSLCNSTPQRPKHKHDPKDLKYAFSKLRPAVLPPGNTLQAGKSLFMSSKVLTPLDEIKGHTASDPKFKYPWFVKLESEEEQVTSEIIVSEAFRVMMKAKELAPKSRVGVRNGKKYTLSKKIDGFNVWASLVSVEKAALFGCDIEQDPYPRTALVNYYHMLAVCVLLGQHDLHSGNWGVIEKEGEKWAAVIDHGRSIVDGHIQRRGDLILSWLNNPLSTAPLLTKEFVDALNIVAQEAEEKKHLLRDAFADGLERAQRANLKGSSTITLDSLLDDLEHNINFLRKAAFFIEAQIAIYALDWNAFQHMVYDERFLELVAQWKVLKLRFDDNDPQQYFFNLITQDTEHKMWAKYLKASIIEKNPNFYKYQTKYIDLESEYFETHHCRMPSKVNNSLFQSIEVYETIFSEAEKAVVEREFKSLTDRLQVFRDAYMDARSNRVPQMAV